MIVLLIYSLWKETGKLMEKNLSVNVYNEIVRLDSNTYGCPMSKMQRVAE